MIEIKPNLYQEEKTKVINGKTYTFRTLTAKVGYCFCATSEIGQKDEEGNIIEPIYMRTAKLGIHDSAENYTVIPIAENMELVN